MHIIKPVGEDKPINIGGGTISDPRLHLVTVEEKTADGDDAYNLIHIANKSGRILFDHMDKLCPPK